MAHCNVVRHLPRKSNLVKGVPIDLISRWKERLYDDDDAQESENNNVYLNSLVISKLEDDSK